MSREARCELCHLDRAVTHVGDVDGLLTVTQACRTCGHWRGHVDLLLPELRDPANASLLPYLAAHIRQANAAGIERVDVSPESWRRVAATHARSSVSNRLDLLLRWFEQRTKYAGYYMPLGEDIHPLVNAFNHKEVVFLTATLVAQGFLEIRPNRESEFRISARGWERLHPATAGVLGTCFVAMSFDPTLNAVFDEGIYPALESDCGYQVIRVDRTPHNDSITDRILAGIRSSQFLVADFTGQRQGVYYEAGFAQGLGHPVIRTCRDTDFDTLHFDTRQFFHLKWSTPVDLRTSLANHVLATIGPWRPSR
jgi:hypothetical protein